MPENLEENPTSLLINKLTTLREMSKQYKQDIAQLTTTDEIMPLQEELELVVILIVETTQLLEEIRDATLKKSRELLKLVPNDQRFNAMDQKLKNLGYGGRKTRKRKSRR
jgi:hypothetical protein